MARPVTLFTGQWADLPLEELAPLAKEMGYDGLELACWGDHFEVRKALAEDGYVERQRGILERNGLECFAIGNHLVGQAVCDPIDERHRATLPEQDRKSTRLNSSHANISYAVFCLKKYTPYNRRRRADRTPESKTQRTNSLHPHSSSSTFCLKTKTPL